MTNEKACCDIKPKKATVKKAVLYRMVTDEHICPFGIKSKDLLERKGYEVEDNHLTTRAETDAFKEKHDVETTPQTFIGGERIGGHDDLLKYFDEAPAKKEGKTYQPVIAVFAMTLLMALGIDFSQGYELSVGYTFKTFIALSISVLAILKLQDINAFSNQFITYDLLGRRWVRYAYIYPFAEAFVGVGMLASILTPVVGLVGLVIGTIGAISVFKAVYIEKRDLKCACVGGDSNVPLGFISLTENLMMMGMGVWLLCMAL